MKKILLMSTAALALGAVWAVGIAPAMAQEVSVGEPFKLQIKGQSNNMVGVAGKGKQDGKVGRAAFVQYNRLNFLASVKNSDGLTYGATMSLNAHANVGNSSLPTDNQGNVIHESFLWVKSPSWGEVRAGNVGSPGATNYTPHKFAAYGGNTGGINGGVYASNFIGDQSNMSGNPQKLAKAVDGLSFLGAERTGSSKATKIGYATPNLSGFTAGLSFAPDGTNRAGANAFRSEAFTPSSKDLLGGSNYYNWIEAATDYTGGDKDLGYSLGVSYTHAQAKDSLTVGRRYEDINSIYGGAQITSGGFAFGGGVTFNGKSRQYVDLANAANNKNENDAIGYGLGAEYTAGPWLFGLWGQYATAVRDSSIAGKNTLTNGGVNATYTVAPGLTVYSELYGYNYKDQNEKVVYHNTTSGVLLIGSAVMF